MLQLKFFLKLKWQEIIEPIIENRGLICFFIICYVAGFITSFGINQVVHKGKLSFIENFLLGFL